MCYVQSLHSSVSVIPPLLLQALAASLACLQPVEGDWTPEDNFWFNKRWQSSLSLEILLTLYPRVSGRQLVGLVHSVEPRLLLELRDPRDNTAVHRQLVQVSRLLHLGGKRRTRNDPSQQKSFNNRSLFIKQVSRVLYLIDIYRLRERLDERL